jgi:WhiB family redox-sensing transcriptional regulator
LSSIFPSWPDDTDDPPTGQLRSAAPDDPHWASADWMARGACHGIDPELFFPISARGRSTPQIDAAKTVCGRCVVSDDCLSYALRVMPDGIWGGTTREERIAMRRRLVRARVPAEG